MKKDKNLFLNWWLKKFEIDNINQKHIVKKRQFWLYHIWVNIWNEESKEVPYLRPCLILNNYFKWDLVLILPFTSKFNEKLADIYYKVEWEKYWLDKDSYLILNQFKVISKKRLIRKITKNWDDSLFDNNNFLDILGKIKDLI